MQFPIYAKSSPIKTWLLSAFALAVLASCGKAPVQNQTQPVEVKKAPEQPAPVEHVDQQRRPAAALQPLAGGLDALRDRSLELGP